MKYRVMAQMETGEECCMVDGETREACECWIEDKSEDYPEMVFWIEQEIPWNGWTEIEAD
jgi:hypothetical protein